MPRSLIVFSVLAFSAFMGCDVHTSRGERNPVEYDMRSAERARGNQESVIRADDMRKILSMKAQPLMAALNESGVRQVDASAVQVLIRAWEGAQSEEPSLNWKEMDRSDVRFAIANQLVRARMNDAMNVPVGSIAEFGRVHLNGGSDEGTLNRAIYLVVLAGDESDMDAVKGLLLDESSQTTFRAGVSALASVCTPHAAEIIGEIRADSNDVRRSIVDEVTAKSAAFRERRCKGRQ